jgi:hypothetical protein
MKKMILIELKSLHSTLLEALELSNLTGTEEFDLIKDDLY